MRATSLRVVICALLTVGGADASTIFLQNFEAGLGANESTSGLFVTNTTGFGNNGTTMMGHAAGYTSDEYSYYQVILDLMGVSNTFMTFDFAAQIEVHFDGFNVQGGIGGVAPPVDTIYPTPASGMQYAINDHFHHPSIGNDYYDSSAIVFGIAAFDLSAFDGAANVVLRFQFGSDGSIEFGGFNMDNLLVSGDVDDPTPAPVPEPGSFLLLGAGFAGVIAARRHAHR